MDETIRIENVRIFDSRAAVMTGPHDVEIAEGTIRSILPREVRRRRPPPPGRCWTEPAGR